jgi:hypothetical protein
MTLDERATLKMTLCNLRRRLKAIEDEFRLARLDVNKLMAAWDQLQQLHRDIEAAHSRLHYKGPGPFPIALFRQWEEVQSRAHALDITQRWHIAREADRKGISRPIDPDMPEVSEVKSREWVVERNPHN